MKRVAGGRFVEIVLLSSFLVGCTILLGAIASSLKMAILALTVGHAIDSLSTYVVGRKIGTNNLFLLEQNKITNRYVARFGLGWGLFLSSFNPKRILSLSILFLWFFSIYLVSGFLLYRQWLILLSASASLVACGFSFVFVGISNIYGLISCQNQKKQIF